MSDKKGWSWSKRIQVLIVAGAAAFVVQALKDSPGPAKTPSEKTASGHYDRGLKSSDFSRVDAHVLCDAAIKGASINASQVEIPYKVARETPDYFGFIWRREDGLKMPNAFGALVDTVVICRVSRADRRVELLEINGDVVFNLK